MGFTKRWLELVDMGLEVEPELEKRMTSKGLISNGTKLPRIRKRSLYLSWT